MIDPQFQSLTPRQALEAISHYENEADRLLATAKMDQWTAWEMYFALMYECNVRALNHPEMEKEFDEARTRIVSKIDQKKFNPFLSKNPAIATKHDN
jgi:hypothetical protein